MARRTSTATARVLAFTDHRAGPIPAPASARIAETLAALYELSPEESSGACEMVRLWIDATPLQRDVLTKWGVAFTTEARERRRQAPEP